MTTKDVAVGDEVRNKRSGKEGRVVAVSTDEVTGNVLRVRVRRRLNSGLFSNDTTWWDAASVVMVETKAVET